MNTELVRQVLNLKQQISKSSVSKWKAFDKCQVNGRVHGMFQFGGASRTNRWAGRLVQLQNLPRGGNTTKDPSTLAEIMLSGGHELVTALYDKPLMALSDTVRAAITAPDGLCLNVSDLSSIESRVIGWIADCRLMNKTFEAGMDTYKVFATELYNIDYADVTKKQRNFSKPPVLGCGYMLGKTGLVGYAEGMGIQMDETQAQIAVDTFRSMYFEIPELWDWCKTATFTTTRTGESVEGKHGLKTFAHGEFLFMQLPSGRCIAYHKPEIKLVPAPWKDKDGKHPLIYNFTFMGKDRFTLKWTRISAHPGFLVENCIAENTRVLTDRGWKFIQNITRGDRVHDGVEFVNHRGLLLKSVQGCVSVDGVCMTPEHEVLDYEQRWQAASKNPKPYRMSCWDVGGRGNGAQYGFKTSVEIPMRLWGDKTRGVFRDDETPAARTATTLRLLQFGRSVERHSWDVRTQSLCRVAVDERQMQTPHPSSVQKLWCAGYRCLRRLAAKVRELLVGHGANIPGGIDVGQERQREGVLRRKLPVGRPLHASQQSTRECENQHTGRSNDSSSSVESLWDREDDNTLQNETKLAGRQVAHKTQLQQSRVYDILNCGPRQRFVVLGDSGPFIVHNCVQAAARDILAVWMERAHEAGFNLCGHVHDELICLESEDQIDELNDLIRQPISWAPGLLLDAEGYVAQRYRKE